LRKLDGCGRRLFAVAIRFVPWLAAVPAAHVWAHAGGADGGWRFDPWVWAGLGLLLVLRPRRPWCFALALAALVLALVWPLDVLSETRFAAHMAQHMLLIAVAAPLLALALPSLPSVRRLPAGAKRGLGALYRRWSALARPRSAFVLHALAVWIGHAPLVIAWTIASRWAHVAEHVVLLGTAYLFWTALRKGGRARAGAAALWTLAMLLHTGLLGALLTFAPRVLYPGYTLEDQQLAGLIMWIPGGLCYLAAGLAFAAAWLGAGRRAAPLSPAARASS
jgi:cytochrome c oxidase assembly factor CtaG